MSQLRERSPKWDRLWSREGNNADIAAGPNHRGVTITTWSAHLQVIRGPVLRVIVFGENSARIVDERLDLTPAEIDAAFNMPIESEEQKSANDALYAEEIDADVAIRNKFARRANGDGGNFELVFFYKTKDGKESSVSFLNDEYIRSVMRIFLRFLRPSSP